MSDLVTNLEDRFSLDGGHLWYKPFPHCTVSRCVGTDKCLLTTRSHGQGHHDVSKNRQMTTLTSPYIITATVYPKCFIRQVGRETPLYGWMISKSNVK